MINQIKLIKNNDNLDLSDVEWIRMFYEYLMTEKKLTKSKAFSIIYYLQEHLPVFPDHIELCSVCGELFDSWASGHYSDLTGKHYCCESCEPEGLYEREQKAEKRRDAPFQKWLKLVKKEHKNYPLFKGKEINENYLRNQFGKGKSPIDALNAICTAT